MAALKRFCLPLFRGPGLFLCPQVFYSFRPCRQCTLCRQNCISSTTLEHRPSSQTCFDNNEDQNQAPLDSLYTPEQRAMILHVLNTASESELAAVKLLRGRKATNIVEYRGKHGPFLDLNSVLSVPLLKHKTTAIVFSSILSPSSVPARKVSKGIAVKFIKPEVDREILKASKSLQMCVMNKSKYSCRGKMKHFHDTYHCLRLCFENQSAESIVSIVYGTNRIAWAHMDHKCVVQDWQEAECPAFMRGTYLAAVYLEDISAVASRIPQADLYILEKSALSLQNTNLFPIMLHLRTVEAMLLTLLAARFKEENYPRVLNMQRTSVGKHFGLMVGESRTSGITLLQQMLCDSVIQKHSRVYFLKDMVVRYKNMFQPGARKRREEMCDALLQAIAFYELLSST
ncbi:TEFM protein, partial [Polypterus senegalus]|nr:TEFM protein [Polypterus senegalus]